MEPGKYTKNKANWSKSDTLRGLGTCALHAVEATDNN